MAEPVVVPEVQLPKKLLVKPWSLYVVIK